MICVSLGNLSFQEAIKILDQVEMAELRLDLLNFNRREIKKIFSSHPNLIATFRSGRKPEKERKTFLFEAITSGARYVDLDLKTDLDLLNQIKEKIKKSNCHLIISYHDVRKTPSQIRLQQIINQAFRLGAQIAKIACYCRQPADNARLLSLLDDQRSIVVCGLGPIGLVTRIAAPLCGSPFTYAYWDGYEPTSFGQISYQKLSKVYKLFNFEKIKIFLPGNQHQRFKGIQRS